MDKNWSEESNFYSEMMFIIEYLLLFCTNFVLMLHNNIVKNQEFWTGGIFENLPKFYLPNRIFA